MLAPRLRLTTAGTQLNWPVSIATATGRPLPVAGRAFLAELMAAVPEPALQPD